MIKWQERFSTGLESIDRQHQLLFGFFNDFEENINEGRGKIYLEKSFSFLEAYAKAHFKFEENCMDQHQCPCALQNKEAHAQFMNKIIEFKTKFASGQCKEGFYVEIHQFLEQWITNHIINIDGQLKNCI